MAKKKLSKAPAVLAGGGAPISDTADEMSTKVAVKSETSAPGYEDIAKEAYRRYLERGGGHGRDFEDWLEAERHLRSGS